ncbi:MAG TPA: DNA replication and repair protein RecF, partial [Terriglobales bacterium]|nr:DNA replication and repair protein RecF [Terriglobales bacterium]
LSLDFVSGGRAQNIEVSLFADGRRKEMLLNGLPVRKTSELSGVFCTALFSPEHLSLVRDGPEERRKFLDAAISQLRPKYQAALADYARVLSQRNFLLKKGGGPTMPVWDERLAALGSYIVMMRGSYTAKLKKPAGAHHAAMSGGEALTLDYKWFDEDEAALYDIKALKELFAKRLTDAAGRELEAGVSLVGPHRDDLELDIDGAPARIFGSQGQQRSAVLALKLAECEIAEETAGEPPVLLLDDVMSELDASRRAYVRKNIGDRQVVITTVSRTKNGVKMEGGKIIPCTST